MITIEITPDWILSSLAVLLNMDDDGNVGVETNNLSDAKWLVLALNTLSINYEEYGYLDIGVEYFGFEFKLDDVKEACPSFYYLVKSKNV